MCLPELTINENVHKRASEQISTRQMKLAHGSSRIHQLKMSICAHIMSEQQVTIQYLNLP